MACLATLASCAVLVAQETNDYGFEPSGGTGAGFQFDGYRNGYGFNAPALELPDGFSVSDEFVSNSFKVGLWRDLHTDDFLFDRDPFVFDFNGAATLKAWDGGFIAASASHVTLPGLLGMESGAFTFTQDFGKVRLTGGVSAEKYRTFRGLDTNYGISGMLSYQVDERFSLNVFGQYYKNSLYYSPATLPYVSTSKFGIYADMQFGEHFGMDVGVSREYDPYTRRWLTVPIAAPYVKLNNGVKLGFDFGRLVGELLDGWLNNGRYYNSGNPTIMPPIPPMPPVR